VQVSTSNNSVKGKLQWYYEQARDGAPDLQAVLLKKAGQQADDAFADNTTLAAVITAGNVEADFTGPNGGNYARKTIALPTVTVVNATDRLHLGGAAVGSALSITWTAAGGTASNELGRMLICYVPVPGTSQFRHHLADLPRHLRHHRRQRPRRDGARGRFRPGP